MFRSKVLELEGNREMYERKEGKEARLGGLLGVFVVAAEQDRAAHADLRRQSSGVYGIDPVQKCGVCSLTADRTLLPTCPLLLKDQHALTATLVSPASSVPHMQYFTQGRGALFEECPL